MNVIHFLSEMKTGDVYDGQWENGRMHGRGKFTWSNGEVFDGDWAHDTMIPESQKNQQD